MEDLKERFDKFDVVFHETTFPFVNTSVELFSYVSLKSVSPFKPFFLTCDPFFQNPSPVGNSDSSITHPSPDIPKSHESAPFENDVI